MEKAKASEGNPSLLAVSSSLIGSPFCLSFGGAGTRFANSSGLSFTKAGKSISADDLMINGKDACPSPFTS